MRIYIYDTPDFTMFNQLPPSEAAKHSMMIERDNGFIPRKGDIILWHEEQKLEVVYVIIQYSQYNKDIVFVLGKIVENHSLSW